MNCFLPFNKLLAIVAAMILSATVPKAAAQNFPSDWPYEDNPAYGHNTVYFIDKEFRNGGMTSHLWIRTTGEDGKTTDTPYTEWEKRPSMELTGYQYEVDGTNYPLYRLSFEWYDSSWNRQAPTHLMFRSQSGDKTVDYKYNFGYVYSFGKEAMYEGEPLDGSKITPITEGKHTVYLAYRSNYSGPNPQDYVWGGEYYAPYDAETGKMVYPLVHVWGTGGDLTPYAKNGEMSEPKDPAIQGKVVKYAEGYSNFYEYTFYYFGGEPTNLLFHMMYTRSTWSYDETTGESQEKKSLVDFKTGDLDFVEGGVYYYNGQNVVTEVTSPAEFLDCAPDINLTFYFADTDHWVYRSGSDWYLNAYWSANDRSYDLTANTEVEFTGKYIKINDGWYRVFKINATIMYYDGVINDITLTHASNTKRNTAPLQLHEGSIYYYAGNLIPTPEIKWADVESELLDDAPQGDGPQPATIYVNLGANQLMEEELWRPPYCHAYLRPQKDDFAYEYDLNQVLPPAVENESERTDDQKAMLEKEVMTEIRPGFYSYTIDDVRNIDDIVLYYYATDREIELGAWKQKLDGDGNPVQDENGNDVWEQDTTYRYFPNIFMLPASRSPHFDPTEFTRYVYDIGVDCVHQSYITYDQLQDILNDKLYDRPYLYLEGNSTVDPSHPEDDPIYSQAIPNDHGCFFTDFVVGEESPAVFKFSTIDVAAAYDGLGRGRECYDMQRGWATYNQGIVGCHIDPARSDYKEWYAKHVVRPEGSPSRQVSININQCLDYNSYCQYPWRVAYDPTGEKGVKIPGQYWFVVDFNEDDQTVVLLDFDPHPHVVDVPDNVREVNISTTEQAETLHNGEYAEACAHNGKILFESVNVASGALEVRGTGNDAIQEAGFDVVYTVYTEDGTIIYEGKPDKMNADFMELSADTGLAVRGRFHYQYFDSEVNDTVHKYFRTRYSAGEIDLSNLDLTAPDISQSKTGLVLYMASPTEIAVGGVVNFKYNNFNPKGYVFMPDYRVTSMSVDGGNVENVFAPLVHKDHFINNNDNPWRNWLGQESDTPWQPAAEGDAMQPVNHWGNYIVGSESGNMPIIFERLKMTDDRNLNKCDVKATMDFIATYPFLTHVSGKLIDLPAVNKAKARSEEAVPSDLENYKMVRYHAVTPQTIEFARNVVTGVEDIAIDAVDGGEPEYYNLQGIHVSRENLSPGVYVERRGNQAKKIFVE